MQRGWSCLSRHTGDELRADDTLSLKGIALVLLLLHHLFYQQRGLYADWQGIVQEIGIFSKICVALFVFLSGYGIVKSARGKMSAKRFCRKGFTKLYLNYWFIWLLFVPIGVFGFDITLQATYGEPFVLKLLSDLLGLATGLGVESYNITWWFYSCILLLYLLAPGLYRWSERWPLRSLAVAWLFMEFCTLQPVVGPIRYYLFPFVLGMVCAHKRWISELCQQARRYPWVAAVAFLALVLLRSGWGIKEDGLLSLAVVVLFQLLRLGAGRGGTLLRMLGRHSFNIFLFHTFIYYYWLEEWVYWSANPLVAFLTLMLSSLVISMGMEQLKRVVGFYRLQGWLMGPKCA